MAYVIKRGSIWWVYQYRPGGQRIRKRVGRDKAEAVKLARVLTAAAAEAKVHKELDLPEILISIAAELRERRRDLKALGQEFIDARRGALSEATLTWYSRYVLSFAEAFAGRPLRALRLAEINRWLAGRRARTNYVRSLKVFGTYLEEEDIWPRNPFKRLRARTARRVQKKLSAEEVTEAEKALTADSLLGPFLAGVYAGLRASEICHARLERYDRDGGLLVVGPWGKWQTKNMRSRAVPVHAKLAAEIRAGKGGWMFLSPLGKQWNRHNLYRQMKKRAGCGLHALRHTFVSRLLSAGVGSSVARDLAGHSTIAVTDGYAHTDLTALREAIGKL